MNIQFKIFKPEILEELGYWLFLLIPMTLILSLLSSPLFEEPCWRGFALGELQMKFGRHLGSLLLGSFWWLWHQPINIANGTSKVSFCSYLFMVGQSFLYDSLFNLSGKNLLSAMLVHSSSNLSYIYIFHSNSLSGLLVLLIAIIGFRTVEWKVNSNHKFDNYIKNIKKN
jgi:membrane protease YdiL (CAAX protease family)